MHGAIPESQLSLARDLVAGTVVSLVALPLCLGIALASDAPQISVLISGVIGGILVGWISGTHTSVSGPAAGLTAIVAAQIAHLGSYEVFLLAVVIGGFIQIGLGLVRAGEASAFVPSSVIRGLLAAIGIMLILKQVPHLLGHDTDPVGEMAFAQRAAGCLRSDLRRQQRPGPDHLGPSANSLINSNDGAPSNSTRAGLDRQDS